ncbi:uncharacterized protein LOC115951403 [Quercus lobata]|uniref:uncharacterized protein LOC115951403 n=1 Tax=Quercus lobata TaxID=97700 RepID=UPI0012470BAC|nr:uncharacterized protein LOC115951403 [Quercus lobata]
MRLISWNCQVLGNPWTGRSLHKIVREQAPTICFFMETRLDKDGFVNLYSNLPFNNKIIVKHPDAGGGLAFLWKNTINLEIINYTANHVLAVVTEEDGFRLFLIGFYGWPEAQKKVRSWRLSEHLKTFIEGPWMIIGDFNAFLHALEKKSRRPPQTSQVDAFRDALESCQLQDLGFKGQRREKSFKFEESWLLKADCETMVKEAWGRENIASHGLESIKQKIQMCGAELLSWGSAWTDPDVEAIKEIQKRLDKLNEEEISETSKAEFLDLSKRMDELLQKHEIY